MNSNHFRRALLIFLGLIFLIVGVFYWQKVYSHSFHFQSTYGTDFKSAPEEDPDTVVEIPGVIRAFDITHDESTIAIVTTKEVTLYNLTTLQELVHYPVDDRVYQASFSPDGSKLAIIGILLKHYQTGPVYVKVWDVASWKPLYEYKSKMDAYYSNLAVTWSPDGRQLAFSVPEHGLSVIDIASGKKISALTDLLEPPFDADWSPDGTRIISTGDIGYGLRRWRVKDNKWVRLWNSEFQPAQKVRWSPDGHQIISGHFGGNVCIWNTRDNQCNGLIHAHFNSIDGLDWNPQGGKFATASGVIRIWDSYTGDMLSAFGYYDGLIYKDLKWSDPQTIATLETSYTKALPDVIRFWNTSTGETALAFRGWEEAQSNTGFVSLHMDDIKISKDHTIIQVSLLQDFPDTSLTEDWSVIATDSQGRYYPLTNITSPETASAHSRTYLTVPFPEGERITLKLISGLPTGSLSFVQDFSETPGTFTFDPGKLKVGESMSLYQTVDLNGYTLQLTGAQKSSANELIFEFNSEQWYTGVTLSSAGASGSSFGAMTENNTITSSITFSEMPQAPIEVNVTKIYFNITADWMADFKVVKSMFTDQLPAVIVDIPKVQPEPVFASQDPIFLEVQALMNKFETSIPKEVGWVHVTGEIFSENTQPGQVYLPKYIKEEQWYQLDADGLIEKSLITDANKELFILQQSISSGTHTMNLTTGEAMEFPQSHFSLDGILADLNNAMKNGETISRKEVKCDDGSACLLISLDNGNFIRRVWINMETGQQVKLQTSQLLPAGAESIQLTQTFQPVEWFKSPPPEVLGIFPKVMFPKN